MGEIRFELKPVDERPKRSFKRGSKYDPIIDRFLMENHDLVKVEAENRNSNYMRLQLAKLIESRGLGNLVKASVVDGELYLGRSRATSSTMFSTPLPRFPAFISRSLSTYDSLFSIESARPRSFSPLTSCWWMASATPNSFARLALPYCSGWFGTGMIIEGLP